MSVTLNKESTVLILLALVECFYVPFYILLIIIISSTTGGYGDGWLLRW